MTDPISTLILATGGAFLGKFVGPAAESLGKATWEYLSTGATALLTAVEREPHSVELKILTPLVEAASLETDLGLTDVWTAMLANAADPAQRVQVRVGFIEMLRQLALNDVLVLDRIAKASAPELAPNERANVFVETALIKNAIDGGISEKEFAISIDILIQLRLCQVSALLPTKPGESFSIAGSGQVTQATKYIGLTALGWAFIKVCTPPTP